jgi:MFS family permease
MRNKVSGAKAKIKQPLNKEFFTFWVGQAISDLGTSFTQFALPLLVFKLTDSPINLGLTTSFVFLPYLLFGLIIGAWVDRSDRKRLMVYTNLLRGIIIGSIPLLASINLLSVVWLYIVAFTSSTLGIFFGAARPAVIPSLVGKDKALIIKANSRIMATYSLASVVGPILAGLVIANAPFETAFLVDSASFFISALSLFIIKTAFNSKNSITAKAKNGLWGEIVEGLSYLWYQPILRYITLLATGVSFFFTLATAQVVLLAKQHYQASDEQVSLFYTAAGIGAFIFSLLVGRFPRKWSAGRTAIITMLVSGALTATMGVNQWFIIGLGLYALGSGCGVIFNIQVSSLIQLDVPNELLGRVTNTSKVLAWAITPLGALIGGLLAEILNDAGTLYLLSGLCFLVFTSLFFITPLYHSKKST